MALRLSSLARFAHVSRASTAVASRAAMLHTCVPTTAPEAELQQQLLYAEMSDAELVRRVQQREIRAHNLEKALGDTERAVTIRRQVLAEDLRADRDLNNVKAPYENIPHTSFDYRGFYDSIFGTNCESVIGYIPLPLGVVGPVNINGEVFQVPMATTEGALLASTNRGCNAITKSGGAHSYILKNGMTRAPLVRVPSAAYATELKKWIETPENAERIHAAFNGTTNFGKLRDVTAKIAGRNVFIRFACHAGDAMGMNMVTKGSFAALELIREQFPEATLIALSGNVCSDKKSAAVNWIEGRGRSIVCETVLKKDIVEKVLKTTVEQMITVNTQKNLIGSAMAGSLGGFNAHASNIVAAVFLATGNDPAQVVESSQCITILEADGEDLHISVTMPSIEVGTIGGGTSLPAQAAALNLLGCQGANREVTGANADKLAHVVAGTVLAGEISLIAALASNDLLKAHIDLNRKPSASSASATQTRSMHTSSCDMAPSFGHISTGGCSSADLAPSRPLYFAPGQRTATDAVIPALEVVPEGDGYFPIP
eukprot:m.286924 g.286924  ORF g.286924 m.286924 type:complete len:543 (-) comp15784_c3_seq1:821-2449(-)